MASWLSLLHLEDYYDTLLGQGYDTIDALTDIAWEDLEEIGIKKLGTVTVTSYCPPVALTVRTVTVSQSPPTAHLGHSPVKTVTVSQSPVRTVTVSQSAHV